MDLTLFLTIQPYGQSSFGDNPHTSPHNSIRVHSPLTTTSTNIREKKIENVSYKPKNRLDVIEHIHDECLQLKGKNIFKLVSLKKLVDEYVKTLPWCICFSSCCSDTRAIDANDYFKETFNKLSSVEKNHMQQLLDSYTMPVFIEDLPVTGGIYTGYIQDGVFQGKGELQKGKVTAVYANEMIRKFVCECTQFKLKGSFENGRFKNGTKSYKNKNEILDGEFDDEELVKGFIKNFQNFQIVAKNVEYLNGTYSGEWLDNQPEGQGTFTDSEGQKFEGIFRNGRLQETTSNPSLAIFEDDAEKKNYNIQKPQQSHSETNEPPKKPMTRKRSFSAPSIM